jgi:hypothetical protein
VGIPTDANNNGESVFSVSWVRAKWLKDRGIPKCTMQSMSSVVGRRWPQEVRSGRRIRSQPVKTWRVVRRNIHSESVINPLPGNG